MELTLNRPLARTYGWLNVNGTGVRASVDAEAALAEEIPEGVTAEWVGASRGDGDAADREDAVKTSSNSESTGDALNRSYAAELADIRTGCGQDVIELFRDKRTRVYTVSEDTRPEDALRIKIDFDKENAGESLGFMLKDGSELTAIVEYTGGDGACSVLTRVLAGKNAVLRLVQIQKTSGKAVLINDVGGRAADSGRIEWTRLVLGGKDTYDGISAALEGDGSSLDVQAGYRLEGDQRLDMNYEAIHTGKKTSCEMDVAGVLSDNAFKLLRGTIDLRRGCAGAVGNEVEDVLLMDETVRNQTIPVILCAEEDVVGNHGATIGRLDEELINYMESRGIERDAIYEMMARARVDAVIRKIPDEKTVRELLPEEDEEA